MRQAGALTRGRGRFVLAIVLLGVALGIAGPVIAGTDDEPLTASKFSIVVDGVEVAAFNELGGLTRDLGKAPTLELTGPYTSRDEVEAWHESAQQDLRAARKDFSLIMYATDGQPVARYEFKKGAPTTVRITALKAGSSEILYLNATFTAKSADRVAP